MAKKNKPYDVSRCEGVWTVAEAKSKLSEVLRRSSEEGPQQIGKQRPHVVVPLDEWRSRGPEKPHLGRWLIANAPRGCEFDIPPRDDGPGREIPFREIPFADLEDDDRDDEEWDKVRWPRS